MGQPILDSPLNLLARPGGFEPLTKGFAVTTSALAGRLYGLKLVCRTREQLIFYKFIWVLDDDMVLEVRHGKILPGKKAAKHD
jgi:hypothetical protein